jgi:hypothetical protein
MSIPNGVKIARNGVEIGEYLPEAIPVLLSSGTLLPSDNYWKPGMPGWLLLSQFPMPQGIPPAMPPPVARPASSAPHKKGVVGRVAWLVGGFFMPYLFAWRIIFDRAYGFSVGTKVFYSIWTAFILCMVVFPSRVGGGSHRSPVILTASERVEADNDFLKGIDCTIGQKVKKDPVQAVFWYKKAAYAGHPFAQFVLANQYSTGNGVGKDLSEAYALHSIAMAGYDLTAAGFARKNRKELIGEMTSDEVAQGERRIDELIAIIAAGTGR